MATIAPRALPAENRLAFIAHLVFQKSLKPFVSNVYFYTMKNTTMKTILSILVAAAAISLPLQAQSPLQLKPGDIDVKDIEFIAQNTPNFEANGPKGKNVPSPREWMEVEVEFDVDAPKDEVVKDLMFRYYIGFQDKDGRPRVLTGDVTHINLVGGESYYSAVYVAPSTLGEMTGDYRRFDQGAVKAVGVEVYYNGVIVGGKSSLGGSKAKFWQATGTEPGILPKHETPFALLWIDRYADARVQ